MLVEPLQIKESDLNTKRMIDMMAVNDSENVPLYVHTIYRILREMRVVQQEVGGRFNYCEFKRQVMDSGLSPAQLGPLNQRLETLESFMPRAQVNYQNKKQKGKASTVKESGWDSKVCGLMRLRTLAKFPAWLPHDCRPFLPLCNAGECLLVVQRMFKPLCRTEHVCGPDDCIG